jgi:hypothetical protein
VKWRPVPQWIIRAGSGYGYVAQRFSRREVGFDGASVFNSQNTNNYPEAAFGADGPENGQVRSVVSTPQFTDTQSIPLLVSVEWYPVDEVMLFNRARASASYTTRRYYAFNLDDARVWQEDDAQLATTWQVSVATGVMIKLNQGLALSIGANALSSSGNTNRTTDFLPVSDQGSATQDYSLVYDPTSWSFNAYASLAIKL